jgi:hypothetical protein
MVRVPPPGGRKTTDRRHVGPWTGYQTDTIVHVVSNLYDLDQNKLIWSGVSQTSDPASAKEFMTSVSKAVAKSAVS